MNDGLDLFVDQARRNIRIRLVKDGPVFAAAGEIERNRPDAFAHAIVDDHGVRHLGDALQIVLRPDVTL
jgi:hypothetical protein